MNKWIERFGDEEFEDEMMGGFQKNTKKKKKPADFQKNTKKKMNFKKIAQRNAERLEE